MYVTSTVYKIQVYTLSRALLCYRCPTDYWWLCQCELSLYRYGYSWNIAQTSTVRITNAVSIPPPIPIEGRLL